MVNTICLIFIENLQSGKLCSTVIFLHLFDRYDPVELSSLPDAKFRELPSTDNMTKNNCKLSALLR